MTLSEHQTKPPILDGLAEYLRVAAYSLDEAIWRHDPHVVKTVGRLKAWITEVEAVQSAVTQVETEE